MLTPTAEKIFKMKYAIGDETWDQAALRVASYVASPEDDDHFSEYASKFYAMIRDLYFIPGGRVLANAGTEIKSLMNCFVLPMEDSRQGIYQTLKDAAEIFAWGGGVGYNFSKVREEGAPIKTTGGKASGPLSFMSLFDQTGEVIQQASRRGAQMGMLDISHPDIEKFIEFKSELNNRNARLLEEYTRYLQSLNGDYTQELEILQKTLADDQLTHFNISVVLTDAFMTAVLEDGDWDLVSPLTGETVKTVKAKDLFERIARHAWESGDPGVFFKTRTNEDNMVQYIGTIDATNPCGEIPLLPGEACCLGSINLYKFYDPKTKTLDLESLEDVVRLAIRFLDNVQELSETPVDYVNEMCKGLRRLGLGVMGWADLLAEMEVPYDSNEAQELGNFLSWFISFFSWLESMNLAEERGTFDRYDPEWANLTVVRNVLKSRYVPHDFNWEEIRERGFRNVSVTSIAPTGTIALLAGVNSAIEPFFALAYKRNITEGVGNIAKDYVIEINPILFRKLEDAGLSVEEIEEVKTYVVKHGTLEGCPKIPDKIRAAFKTAHEIDYVAHIRMQYAWQEYVSNAVSKTINLPHDATVEDVANAFGLMWNHHLKGGTIYRDGSKSFQILNAGTK